MAKYSDDEKMRPRVETLEKERVDEVWVENPIHEHQIGFRQLFESAPVPMAYAMDADGYGGTFWNSAWYQTFGYPRELAEGKSGAEIGLWVNPPDRHRLIEMASQQNGVSEFETRLRCHDGSIRVCSLFGRFIEKTGKRYLMVVYLDITERKKAEENNKKLQKQLSQAQRMEAIGTLAGGIAHDLNNILFPIMGYSQMLMDDASKESVQFSKLEKIYGAAIRARDLVQQILTFARQDISEVRQIRMQPILHEALQLMRSTIPSTISIQQNIDSGCGKIKADPTQIHQIVINLMTNAYHAMKEDQGGTITISLKAVAFEKEDIQTVGMKPGLYNCLTVSDTGMGMDNLVLEKIFDPFFTTKSQDQGCGMGLSVVHGIVKNVGGEIQVYSEPGQGTEFKIFFPVDRDDSDNEEGKPEEPIRGGSERILFVDDDEILIEMGKEILERLGYRVTSHESSEKALQTFLAAPSAFDIVITDMAMPHMAGDRLAAEVKKIRPEIPVLLCTGFSDIMTEEKALSKGIDGFLMKPVLLRDLSNKIRDLLDQSKKNTKSSPT